VTDYRRVEEYHKDEFLDYFVRQAKEDLLQQSVRRLNEKDRAKIEILGNLNPQKDVMPQWGVIERSLDYNNLLFYLGYVVYEHSKNASTEETFVTQLRLIGELVRFCDGNDSLDRHIFKQIFASVQKLTATNQQDYLFMIYPAIEGLYRNQALLEKYVHQKEINAKPRLGTVMFTKRKDV
jgi:hypothetical protein